MVIIEGILVLHMEAVLEKLNMKIYVDTDDDVRLARRHGVFIMLVECIRNDQLLECPGTRFGVSDTP